MSFQLGRHPSARYWCLLQPLNRSQLWLHWHYFAPRYAVDQVQKRDAAEKLRGSVGCCCHELDSSRQWAARVVSLCTCVRGPNGWLHFAYGFSQVMRQRYPWIDVQRLLSGEETRLGVAIIWILARLIHDLFVSPPRAFKGKFQLHGISKWCEVVYDRRNRWKKALACLLGYPNFDP